jgi:hypothetical protein
MSGDIEMYNLSSIMMQDNKAVQNPEVDCRNGKEIDGDSLL